MALSVLSVTLIQERAVTFWLNREPFGVDYGQNYERISDPVYNYGLPIIPYLGYQLRF